MHGARAAGTRCHRKASRSEVMTGAVFVCRDRDAACAEVPIEMRCASCRQGGKLHVAATRAAPNPEHPLFPGWLQCNPAHPMPPETERDQCGEKWMHDLATKQLDGTLICPACGLRWPDDGGVRTTDRATELETPLRMHEAPDLSDAVRQAQLCGATWCVVNRRARIAFTEAELHAFVRRMERAAAGVTSRHAMRGLAAFLRALAEDETPDPALAHSSDVFRRWANEVDALGVPVAAKTCDGGQQ
jgi:hypothetical protein